MDWQCPVGAGPYRIARAQVFDQSRAVWGCHQRSAARRHLMQSAGQAALR